MANIAINGFGRIGRAFLKAAKGRSELDIVAINDLANIENLAYLLKYDSAYGPSGLSVEVKDGALIVDGTAITVLQEKNPHNLPWEEMGVDMVVESTGVFTSYEKAKGHLMAGARRVVVSAPVKGNPEDAGVAGATVLMGVNDDKLETCDISSNASCTTNAGSPVTQILHEAIGIEKALLNTVHGYTASQSIVDGPHPGDFRRGRAGAQNIVPSTTGAAEATTKAVTDLEGKFDGIATRVPVVVGSVLDITFVASRKTSVQEINDILRKAAKEDRWKKVFAVEEDPVVSTDIIGRPHASIADLDFTRVVDGDLVKVLAWYDNEAGYAHALTEHVITSSKYLK